MKQRRIARIVVAGRFKVDARGDVVRPPPPWHPVVHHGHVVLRAGLIIQLHQNALQEVLVDRLGACRRDEAAGVFRVHTPVPVGSEVPQFLRLDRATDVPAVVPIPHERRRRRQRGRAAAGSGDCVAAEGGCC